MADLKDSLCCCYSVASAGCASPGAPQPPSLHLPRPVSDLQAQRVGDSVQLRWTMPGETTDGLELTGQRKVAVCRRVGAGVCEQVQSFPEMPKAKVAIEDALPPAVVKGSPELLTYEVQVMSPAGRSAGASNPAYTASGVAPAPVSGLQAAVTEQGVVLSWQQSPDTAAEILLRRESLQSATGFREECRSEESTCAAEASRTCRCCVCMRMPVERWMRALSLASSMHTRCSA